MSTLFENLSDEAKSARLLDYVQGRLTAHEQGEIDVAIAGDEKLADELAYYRGLSNAAEPAPVPAGQEFGWARLAKSIDEDGVNSAKESHIANDNHQVWRSVAMALGLIAIVQAGFLFSGPSIPNSNEPIYVPVTETAQFDVRVIFSPPATSADITALLNQIDGEIVAGPSAIGLYDIRFDSESSRDDGLAELRGAETIVENATLK